MCLIVPLSGSLCTLSARAGQHVLPAGADSGGVAQKGTNSSLRSRRRGRTGGKQRRYCFSTLSVVCQGPTQVINSSGQKRLILCSLGQTWVGRSAARVGLCMIRRTSCADVNLIPLPAMVMNLPLDVSADSFWFQFEVTQNNWEFTPCFTCYQCLFFLLLWKSGF